MTSFPDYVAPSLREDAFNCPRCGVYAHQEWSYATAVQFNHGTDFQISQCFRCREESYWYEQRLIDPADAMGPLPHAAMPEEVRGDYEEARLVAALSPRSGAALMRLALQKLCIHLGEPGDNINADIASLVEKGLPVPIQQAADALRVIGNEAIHPGELDLRDDRETVGGLFGLLNAIVEDRIARPKQIEALYNLIPESKRAAIERRDGRDDVSDDNPGQNGGS